MDVGLSRRNFLGQNWRQSPKLFQVCILYYKKLVRRWDSERERFYDNIFNHFYAVRPGSYLSQWNNAKQGPLRRSRSFKVTDFGTNRKLMYDFLLVINTNLPPILHRFRYIPSIGPPNSQYLATPLAFNTPGREVPWDDLHKIFRGRHRIAKVQMA